MVAWAAPKGVNERRDVVGPGARQGAAPELRYVYASGQRLGAVARQGAEPELRYVVRRAAPLDKMAC